MTTDERRQTWPNALRWGAIGFAAYAAFMLTALALTSKRGPGAVFESGITDAILAACLLIATAAAGLGQRLRPINARSVRNFLILNAVAVVSFLSIMGILNASTGPISPRALGASATVALFVGIGLLYLSLFGFAIIAAAHTPASLLNPEQTEAIREQSRVQAYSYTAMAAMALMLVLLSLAGPGGPLSPRVALAALAVLVAVRIALSFAIRPLLDELARTVNRETGHAAFNLIVILGGGWAMLARLGYLRAPAPLDWLTMFLLFMVAASFRAAGKRGLIQS